MYKKQNFSSIQIEKENLRYKFTNFSWHEFDNENHPGKALRVEKNGDSFDIFIKGSSDEEVFFARIGNKQYLTHESPVSIMVPVYRDGELQTELKARTEVGHQPLPGRDIYLKRVVADVEQTELSNLDTIALSEAQSYDPMAEEGQTMGFVQFTKTIELPAGDPKVAQLNIWLKNASTGV